MWKDGYNVVLCGMYTMYMGRGDQHRHRSDCERLSGPGAMWLDGVVRIS